MKIKNFITAILMCFILSQSYGQELSMYPGFWSYKYYQDDQQISKSEFESILNTVPEAQTAWQKSKDHMAYSWLALGAEIGFLVWQLNARDNGKSQTGPFIGVIGTAVAAIGFSISSANLKRKAILKYNQAIEDSGSLYIGPAPNGFGMVYRF